MCFFILQYTYDVFKKDDLRNRVIFYLCTIADRIGDPICSNYLAKFRFFEKSCFNVYINFFILIVICLHSKNKSVN